ncbi:MAG: hypothetical protein WKF70_00830 [Chitinophagaceae bacterium]
MKSVVAYYLLLFYLVAACKPFLPVVSDLLAHTFWHTHHASTVHKDDGDHHLHDQLVESAKEEDKGNTSTASRFSESVSAHFAPNSLLPFISPPTVTVHLHYHGTNLPSPVIEKSVPPPKA